MKRILVLIVAILGTKLAIAQGAWNILQDIKAHEPGQIHWHVGFGLPRVDNNLFSKYQGEIDYNLNGAGPFTTRLEYSFNRRLSFSIGANYTNYWARWIRFKLDAATAASIPYEYGIKVNDFSAVGRLFYHLYTDPRWDVYMAGGMGYQMFMHKDYTTYKKDTAFQSFFKNPHWPMFEGVFGFRHFFLRRTAVFAEVGYGKSYAQVGFIVKVSQPKRNRIF